MAEALRDAYRDLFVLKEHPSDTDRALIEGKFKSAHNTSDRVAQLMANTFFSLLGLADLEKTPAPKDKAPEPEKIEKPAAENKKTAPDRDNGERRTENSSPMGPSLHYNIQIHLPATKDIEVFNAIFKSLKEHLLER